MSEARKLYVRTTKNGEEINSEVTQLPKNFYFVGAYVKITYHESPYIGLVGRVVGQKVTMSHSQKQTETVYTVLLPLASSLAKTDIVEDFHGSHLEPVDFAVTYY
jgi:hypothetical protein